MKNKIVASGLTAGLTIAVLRVFIYIPMGARAIIGLGMWVFTVWAIKILLSDK